MKPRLQLLIFSLCCLLPLMVRAAGPFQDCGDGTITDTGTGLMWSKDAKPVATQYGYTDFPGFNGLLTFNSAFTQIARLNTNVYKGYSDWHLPTISELKSLVCGAGAPVWAYNGCDGSNSATGSANTPDNWLTSNGFMSAQGNYWSSSYNVFATNSVWWLELSGGRIFGNGCQVECGINGGAANAWPVRTGSCPVIYGQISGTVTNALTTAPLAGAAVVTNGQTYVTNAAGRYLSGNLLPGAYTVTASISGFVPQSATTSVIKGQTATLNFSLVPNTIISGAVTNADSDPPNAPLAGATVFINGQPYTTDANGKYTSTNLPPGSHSVTVSKIGFLDQSVPVTPLASQTNIVNISLVPYPVTVTTIAGEFPGSRYFLPDINLPINYTATVIWNGHVPGTVRFITSTRTYDVPATGASVTGAVNVGLDIKPCETLKVMAVAATGDNTRSAQKTADLFVTTKPPLYSLSPIINYNIGGTPKIYKFDIALTTPFMNSLNPAGAIPAEIPFLGNIPITTQWTPAFAFEFDTSNGLASYDIKLGDATYENELSKKYFSRGSAWGLSDLYKATHDAVAKGKIDRTMLPSFQAGGIQAQFYPHAKLESRFTEINCFNGKNVWTNSGDVGVAGQGKFSIARQFPTFGAVPIPWYLKGSIGLEADLLWKASDFMATGTLAGQAAFGPSISGTVGLGISDLIGIDGTITGKATVNLNLPSTVRYVEWKTDAAVNGTALLYTWSLTNFGPWVGCAPQSEACPNLPAAANIVFASQGGADSALIPRDYLNTPNAGNFTSAPKYTLKTFAAPVTQPYSVAISPIVNSVFPLSDSFLSSAGNNVNLLYVTDNPIRSAANRTMLVHSTFDGTTWSAPQPVANDATADFHPVAITFPDGSVMAAWEDENTVLPDTATLSDALARLAINTALYNPVTGTWGSAMRLSGAASLQHSPKLAGIDSNNILLTWIGNENNDMYGSSLAPNRIWYSFFNGTVWSPPQVAALIPNALKRYSVSYDGTTAHIIAALHSTDNLTSLDNLELYRISWSSPAWGALTRLTTDTVIDDNPQLTLDSVNNVILTWVKGGELSNVINFDFFNPTVIRNDTEYSSSLADFKQSATTDGRVAIIYAQPSETGSSDLFGVIYDPVFRIWGNPKQLTADPETESHPSIAFLGTETVIATYNRKLLLNADGTVPATTSFTDLYMLKHNLGVDLALDGAYFLATPPNPAPGVLATLTVTAMNVGDKPVTDAVVSFYLGDPAQGGMKIGETILTGVFNAGESRDATVSMSIPPTAVPISVYAVIDPAALLDPLNRSDNTAVINLVTPDLTVSTATWNNLSDTLVNISARVANQGALPSTPTTVTFRRDGPTGAVLSTQLVPALAVNTTQDFSFAFDISALSAPNYPIFVAVDESNSVTEYDKNNNSYSITFPGKPQDQLMPLMIQFSGSGGGTVSDAAAGISCIGACQKDIVWNTLLNLSAAPDLGSSFAGWSGACTGTGACQLTMNALKNVTAIFNQNNDTIPDPFGFTAQTDVTPNTVVTSNPVTVSGIIGPAAISIVGGTYSINGGPYTGAAGTIVNGSTVTVQLTSSPGFSVTTSATLTIGGIDGIFSVTTLGMNVSMTVNISGSGSGSVKSVPNDPVNGLNCSYPPQSGKCSLSQPVGATFTLNAANAATSIFGGWGGACIGCGSNPNCLISTDLNLVCSATFNQILPVRLGNTDYLTILDAYVNVAIDSVMKIQATAFTGGFTLDRNIQLTLDGGYNADYSAKSGTSTIAGTVTIQKGSLIVDRMIIR
ncbi:MAG: carboxypeptidase regulatory-like domain-containing protein [Geobacteraceae bacterium]|nr:carboxypeptidase regulatory-like domain-containing protein [Geobacteraceae bacterium]